MSITELCSDIEWTTSLSLMLAILLPDYGDDGSPLIQPSADGDRVAFNAQPASRPFYPPYPGPKVQCSSKCHRPTL